MTIPNPENSPSTSEGLSRVLAQLSDVDSEYRRLKSLAPKRSELVREARAAGATLGDLAKRLGITRASVQSLLKKPSAPS